MDVRTQQAAPGAVPLVEDSVEDTDDAVSVGSSCDPDRPTKTEDTAEERDMTAELDLIAEVRRLKVWPW
jgi:hypothetical protein